MCNDNTIILPDNYVLVTPNNNVIERYLHFREENNQQWNVQLFEGYPEIDDIRMYIVKQNQDGTFQSPYEVFASGDIDIQNFYNNDDIPNFLRLLNSKYHTRLNTQCISNLTRDWFTEHSVDDLIAEYRRSSNTNGNKYSFCTKVYSFVNPEENPIMDSYVSTLLWEYMPQEYKDTHHKREWGNYNVYCDAYRLFRDTYGIDNYSFKELDTFLWTYALAIQNYWKIHGFLSFDSVTYIDPN